MNLRNCSPECGYDVIGDGSWQHGQCGATDALNIVDEEVTETQYEFSTFQITAVDCKLAVQELMSLSPYGPLVVHYKPRHYHATDCLRMTSLCFHGQTLK
jgi:hypothetical protein